MHQKSAGRPALLRARLTHKIGWLPPSPRASIRLCQILNDLADVRLRDGRAVNLDHLGHLGPPEVFLEFRTPRLGLDIVDRMARRAVVLHNLQIGPRLECRRLVRKLVETGLAPASDGP